MKSAPLHPHEADRLRALLATKLLDSPPEERFDRLTRLAAEILDVPMALVSLVDDKRQWFKSRHGLDDVETPREVAFCAHTILREDMFCVPDATNDERFADNPLVTEALNLRAYAGVPIHTSDGHAIGSFCVLDQKPRTFTTQQLAVLKALAHCVEVEVNRFEEQAMRTLIEESKQRSELVLSTLPDIVMIVDRQGRLLDVKDHPDLLLPAAQLLGMYLSEFLPQDLLAQTLAAMERAHASGLVEAYEYDLTLPNGTQGYFEARVRKLRDGEVLLLIRNVTARHQAAEALREKQLLTEVISRAQLEFIQEPNRRRAFDGLLSDILHLTESAYGFIGEILRTPEGSPYLKTYAITNIAWNDATQAFYQSNAPKGMEFYNLKTLFGQAMTTGKPVIANDPYHDPRRGGLPEGHPTLSRFLGIPIWSGGQMVAMIGLANRPQGYDERIVELLSPLLVTIGQLVQAASVKQLSEENERRLRLIIEGTRTGTWEWSVPKDRIVVNERWAKILGYTVAELEPLTMERWCGLVHPDDKPMFAAFGDLATLDAQHDLDLQYRLRHREGHWVWVHDRGRVVELDDDVPSLVSGTRADVTATKQAAEDLAKAYELLERSNQAARIGTWEVELDTNTERLSQTAREILDLGSDDAMDAVHSLTLCKRPEDRRALEGLLADAIQSGETYDYEFPLVTPKGNERWVRAIGTPQLADGRCISLYGLFQDITNQKLAEQEITRSLTEKETLLKEIHHRVKNNLQIISSLLMLQCDKLGDSEARDLLQESILRVRSMALIHQQLYGHSSMSEIDLERYANFLVHSLRGVLAPTARIEVRATPVLVPVDLAVPVGLILNELLTNAFKYGLPHPTSPRPPSERRTGTNCDILLEVFTENDNLHVAVSDSGPGLPDDFEMNTRQTLGRELMNSLSRQLRGQIHVANGGGARFELVCPATLVD